MDHIQNETGRIGSSSEGGGDKSSMASKMVNLRVERSSHGDISARVQTGGQLTKGERNQLALELAAAGEEKLRDVLGKAWADYLEKYPHLKKLRVLSGNEKYNPLVQPPAKVLVIENMRGVASIAPDNSSMSQPISEEEQRRVATVQLLAEEGDFAPVYPGQNAKLPHGDKVYEAWGHESFHGELNPLYKKIVDVADRIEAERAKQEGRTFLTIGDRGGKYGAIAALQEIAVRLATSETLGTLITSTPNDLLSGGYVTILPVLRARAAAERQADMKAGKASKEEDEYIGDLWYEDPLREDVRMLCRTFIQARVDGINPMELAHEVNRVILLGLEGNPGVRHLDYDYKTITGIASQAIIDRRVETTLPRLEVDMVDVNKQEEIITMFTSQRSQLQQLVASRWVERDKK